MAKCLKKSLLFNVNNVNKNLIAKTEIVYKIELVSKQPAETHKAVLRLILFLFGRRTDKNLLSCN